MVRTLSIRREIRELAAPITKGGVDYREMCSVGSRGHVSAREFESREGQRPENFTPSTVILRGAWIGGWGVWDLQVPDDVRKSLIDMTLKIETVRTHGMLHSPHEGRTASVFVNDQLLDRIKLVRPHPHGEDYGVDSRRPFPVFRYIDLERDTQTVKIAVEEGVAWDIDRITLEPVTLRREIRPEIAMVVGAFISAVMGVMAFWLISLF